MVDKKVNKLIDELKKLGENESYIINLNINNGYSVEVGYFAKNGKGKYAIRLKYGITTILKIRNTDEFENIKKLIKFLEEKKEILEALDKLNSSGSSKTNKNKNILRLWR